MSRYGRLSKGRSQCAIWLDVGIGLLVMGLAACDDKDTNATAQGSVAESNATGNPVNLLDGKLFLAASGYDRPER